uniref:C-type lectin domain-containing protein n=1 Tax=Panagrolaimus sp. ES5 TaxID=591445 RepID=A0AC34FHP5_9BILA
MMFLLFCICCLLANVVTAFKCPENSKEWESKCYIFVSEISEFMNAEINCRSLGGHLASIPNAFTNAFIAQQAAIKFQGSGTSDAWLGGSSLANSKIWTWTDGQPFTFSQWTNSSAVKGQTCTAVGLANGLWMADDCYEAKPYICIIDKNVQTTTTATTHLTTTPTSTTTTSKITTASEASSSAAPTSTYFSSTSAATASSQTTTFHKTTQLFTSPVTTEARLTTSTSDVVSSSSSATATPKLPTVTTSASQSTTPLTNSPKTVTTIPIENNTTSSHLSTTTTEIATATPFTSTSTNPKYPCPHNWTYFATTSSCYFSTPPELSWKDAEEFCVDKNARLASIHSDEELEFVNKNIHWGWIGLHKTEEEWKWIDNSQADYFKWHFGNPELYSSTCGHILNLFRNDFECSDLLRAICKMTISQN